MGCYSVEGASVDDLRIENARSGQVAGPGAAEIGRHFGRHCGQEIDWKEEIFASSYSAGAVIVCSVGKKPRVVAEDQACWPVVGNPGFVDGAHCSCPQRTDLDGHLSSTLCGQSQDWTKQTARRGQSPVVSDKAKLQ